MVQLQSLLTTRNRSCLRFCNGLNPWNHPLGKQQEASFSRLSIYHLILKTIRQKERWIHSNSMAVIFILYLLEILHRLASIFPPPVGRFFLLGNYCRGPKCLQRFVVSSASGSRFACFACFVWGALSWCFACFACSLAQSMQVLEMDQTLTRQLLEETGQMLSWLGFGWSLYLMAWLVLSLNWISLSMFFWVKWSDNALEALWWNTCRTFASGRRRV